MSQNDMTRHNKIKNKCLAELSTTVQFAILKKKKVSRDILINLINERKI